LAYYVTSDTHGYPIDRFLGLLEKAGFCSEDFLYILGDVVDRGEDSPKYLEWLLTVDNVQLILGNHEAMLLACEFVFEAIANSSVPSLDQDRKNLLTHWMYNGSAPTLMGLKSIMEENPDKLADILDYLKDCPLYVPLTVGERDFLLVHGGLGKFRPDKKFSEYLPEELFWHRPTHIERYFDDITVIIGHTPVEFYAPARPNRMFVTDTWIDIDTGAACDRAPMLLRLDDMQEFYIDE